MLGNYFYHASTRKLISAFGSLFSNLRIVRIGRDGDISDVIQVPIRHGPRDNIISFNRDVGELNPDSFAKKFMETFPRMTFEMTGMNYNSNEVLNRNQRTNYPDGEGGPYSSFVPPYVPYIFDFNLYVIAKNKTDGLQIVEQIIPFFRPQLIMSLQNVPKEGSSVDIPVTLMSVSEEDNYEDTADQHRRVIYTLGFQIKYGFYGPVRSDYESAVQEFVTKHPVEVINTSYGECKMPEGYSPDMKGKILKVIIDYYASEEAFNDSNYTSERQTITADPWYARDHDAVEKYNIDLENNPGPRPEDAE